MCDEFPMDETFARQENLTIRLRLLPRVFFGSFVEKEEEQEKEKGKGKDMFGFDALDLFRVFRLFSLRCRSCILGYAKAASLSGSWRAVEVSCVRNKAYSVGWVDGKKKMQDGWKGGWTVSV